MHRLLVVVVVVACSSEPRAVEVTVDTSLVVAEIDPRFLSVAVDAAQVVGGTFWDPDGGSSIAGDYEVDPYDFGRPRLRALAKELAPAYLRVGGTEADRTFYDLGATPVTDPPEGYEWVLTAAMWQGMVDFARDLDYRLMFTLNAGIGPRVSNVWQPDQARVLVRHAALRGDPIDIWELGNEINGYPLINKFDLSPAEYAADLGVARAVLDAEMPAAKLAGPSSAFWPKVGEFIEFSTPTLAAGAAEHLDLITWHYYPQQSLRCPLAVRSATPDRMLDPANLDEVHVWSDIVTAGRDQHAAGTPIWLGETGNAQCGGEPGVSDAFAGTFWWLDQLGTIARRGQPVVIRQTLSGSNYGLLDDVTLDPNPDYWASLLWRRLMGTRVLAASSPDPSIRIYAHCAADGPGVALVAVNISQTETLAVRVPALSGSARRYRVTASGLDARVLELEGRPLHADASGTVPALEPASVDNASVELPPTSWAFVVSDEPAAACAQ